MRGQKKSQYAKLAAESGLAESPKPLESKVMENNLIKEKAVHFIEESLALQQIFRSLPEGTQMNLSVAERIELHLFFREGQVRVEDGHVPTADVLYSVDSEVFRRLGDRNPSDISDFYAELGREVLAGRVQLTLLKPVTHFMSHNYLEFLKNIAPALQGEALQKAMVGASKLGSFVEGIKQNFRPKS